MKKNLFYVLLICGLLLPNLNFAQVDFQMGYAFSSPQGAMATNIKRAHGFTMQGLYRVPRSPFSVGLELGVSNYGHQNEKQQYYFDNDTYIDADVIINNNIYTSNLVTRVDFLEPSAINPYIQGKAGIGVFSTNLRIEDPRATHTDECPQPLETAVLASDVSFMTSVGLGTRVDLGYIFKGVQEQTFYADLSVNYTHGTQVRYMSVDAPEISTRNLEGVEEVNLKFATQSQPDVIHEYHTGYSYKSPIDMLEIKFSLGYSFQ